MSKKSIFIILSVAAIMVVFFFLLKYVQYNAKTDIDGNKISQENVDNEINQNNQKIEVGNKFPDFKFKSLDGKEVSLKDYRGKIVFLNFWATWCIYCDKEMPDLQELYKNNKDDLVVLAVDVGEDKSTVEKYVNDNGYTFPILLDENATLASKLDIKGFPTTFFVDKNGNLMGFTDPNNTLVDRFPGMMTKDQMSWFLQQLKAADQSHN